MFSYRTSALIQKTDLTVDWSEAEGSAIMRVRWKGRTYFATFAYGSAEYLNAIRPILWAYVDGIRMSVSVEHGNDIMCHKQEDVRRLASDWYIEIIDDGLYLCDDCSVYGRITLGHNTMESLRRQVVVKPGKVSDAALKVVNRNLSDGDRSDASVGTGYIQGTGLSTHSDASGNREHPGKFPDIVGGLGFSILPDASEYRGSLGNGDAH